MISATAIDPSVQYAVSNDAISGSEISSALKFSAMIIVKMTISSISRAKITDIGRQQTFRVDGRSSCGFIAL